MKNFVIDNSLKLIIKYNTDYTEEKIEEIKYGLTGLYLTISKSIVIFLIAYLLGIFKELFIFTLLYSIIRAFSFGSHASKSSICLVLSAILFISMTYVCNIVTIPVWFKIVLGLVGIICFCLFSPADTEKRPIINLKRRFTYKILSTMIALVFVLISLFLKNTFIANSLVLSVIVQSFFISPISYKLLGQKYNNFKKYIE